MLLEVRDVASLCVVAVEQSVAPTSSPPIASCPLHCARNAYTPPLPRGSSRDLRTVS
jgi:hypothetical protein